MGDDEGRDKWVEMISEPKCLKEGIGGKGDVEKWNENVNLWNSKRLLEGLEMQGKEKEEPSFPLPFISRRLETSPLDSMRRSQLFNFHS